MPSPDNPDSPHKIATFGAGCFWCVEAVFLRIPGVLGVKSGYMGGDLANPSYQQVCGGRTGHAEVIQITYDPGKVSFEELLSWFWRAHDPTTLNRQGNDVGTQYRSAIFYHSDEQKEAAEKSKAETDASGLYKNAIVTEITEATTFWEAEEYHQDFFNRNPRQPYCQALIPPKLAKLGLEE